MNCLSLFDLLYHICNLQLNRKMHKRENINAVKQITANNSLRLRALHFFILSATPHGPCQCNIIRKKKKTSRSVYKGQILKPD